MIEEIQETAPDTNEAGFNFIMANLTLANQWLDGSGTSAFEASRNNARYVFDSILRILPRLTLAPAQQQLVSEGMVGLKARLEAIGEPF